MSNPGIEATRQLAHMGYRFIVNREKITAKYEGPGEPDPAQVRPLLDLVRKNKEAVRYFLRSFCPRCGGVAFCPDYEGRPLCLSCEWDELVRLYPDMAGRKH